MVEQKVRGADEGKQKLPNAVIDVDVHEMLRAGVRDLIPYLDEPWRERIAVPDGWKGFSLPYSWPLIGGVAKADAATDDGSPAGSSYELMRDQLLDAYNVEYALLTGLFYPTEMKVQPEFATALAGAYNDWLLENWVERDRRLQGSVCIAAQEPEAAAREIDRIGAHPRIVQVMLPAIPHDVLGRSFYHPIFEAAVRNDLAIAFHQGAHTATAVGLPPYYIEWHTTIPQNWQSQLVGLMAHGVLDKYPDLRVVLLESGWTWVPSLMWRFDHNYRSLRREVPWMRRMPSEYIQENVRVSTQPMEYPEDAKYLYQMFEMIGSDEFLLFSTDYPHWDFDPPDRVFPSTFPKDVRQKVLYDNAAKFYGF